MLVTLPVKVFVPSFSPVLSAYAASKMAFDSSVCVPPLPPVELDELLLDELDELDELLLDELDELDELLLDELLLGVTIELDEELEEFFHFPRSIFSLSHAVNMQSALKSDKRATKNFFILLISYNTFLYFYFCFVVYCLYLYDSTRLSKKQAIAPLL